MEITREQFALWSFERDFSLGLYDGGHGDPIVVTCWDDLPKDEKEAYLEEADYYIEKHPRDDWPVDILERLRDL